MADIPVFGLDEVEPGLDSHGIPTAPATLQREGSVATSPWQSYFQSHFGNYTPLQDYQTAQADEARRKQQEIIQDLQLQAGGSMDTRAQRELTANNKLGQQSQYAIASGQKGGDMRGAARGAGQVAAQLPGQQNVLKLQEQQSSQQLLAQMLAQQQGQDIEQANNQAQYGLRGRALSDAWDQYMAGQGAQTTLNDYQLQNDKGRALLGLDLENRDIAAGNTERALGAGASALTTLAGFDWGGKKDSGYRQVDGQDSIVPKDDK